MPRRNVAVFAPTATFRSNAVLGALAVGAVSAGPGMVLASSGDGGATAGPQTATFRSSDSVTGAPPAVTIELPTTTTAAAAASDPAADLQALEKGAELARIAAERAEAQRLAAEEARRLAERGGANCASSGFGGVADHVARAGHHLQDRFGIEDVGGVASRPNNPTSDHPSGYALDFMVDTATGNALAAYARSHTDELGIKYILWQVPDHYDHVHISFNRGDAKGLPC